MPIGFSRRCFFFQTHIVDTMNPRGPCRPSAITIGFSHLIFLHNIRRITGDFRLLPRTIVLLVRGKFAEKKAVGKAATAGFRFGEGRVGDVREIRSYFCASTRRG